MRDRRGRKVACLWGKPPNLVFLDLSEDVVMSFCVAGVALCDISCVSGGICVHDRREGKVVKLPCLWGKPPKRVFLNVSEDVVMSF